MNGVHAGLIRGTQMLKKAVIFAGGYGSQLSEETVNIPKPLVEIGGIPILIHIMRYLYFYGIDEFVILCGYKGHLIKQYFNNYELYNRSIEFFYNKEKVYYGSNLEKWNVTCLDTGLNTMTGGRLKQAIQYLKNDNDCEDFLCTYGDGLCDVNIDSLYDFHKAHGKLATVTAIQPSTARFGNLKVKDNIVISFQEKVKEDKRINGGFFILNKSIDSYLPADPLTVFEKEPIENIVKDKQLQAYAHNGFWQCMDTLHDKNYLEEIWSEGNAPWNIIEK